MLLAVSIGNTNTAFGLFDGEELVGAVRMTSDRARTADEWAGKIANALREWRIDRSAITGTMLCSVAPALTATVAAAVDECTDQPPLIVTSEWIHHQPNSLGIWYNPPASLGADRAVTAYALHRLLWGMMGTYDHGIVVDGGTATTFGVVRSGLFLGGMILPGIGISIDALFQRTAQLPRPELKPPSTLIARDTADALRSGILNGFAAQIDGLIQRIKDDLGPDSRSFIVGTGGALPLLLPYLKQIDRYDADLALRGLCALDSLR